MFNGYSTLGAVALRIMDDYIRYPMKSDTRYTVEQAIKRVCFDQTSIASKGTSPAYVWCWFDTDDGEATLQVSPWKMANYVEISERKRRYVAVAEDCSAEKLMGSLYNDIPNDYDQALSRNDRFMLQHGIAFQQRILCRYEESHHCDYWGEWDSDEFGEILYVEPSTGMLHIPITNPLVTQRPYGSAQWNQFSVV